MPEAGKYAFDDKIKPVVSPDVPYEEIDPIPPICNAVQFVFQADGVTPIPTFSELSIVMDVALAVDTIPSTPTPVNAEPLSAGNAPVNRLDAIELAVVSTVAVVVGNVSVTSDPDAGATTSTEPEVAPLIVRLIR